MSQRQDIPKRTEKKRSYLRAEREKERCGVCVCVCVCVCLCVYVWQFYRDKCREKLDTGEDRMSQRMRRSQKS
jgi:hypothetical protein